LRAWAFRGLVGAAGVLATLIVVYAVVPPPGTLTMLGARMRLGAVERSWVPMAEVAPVAARAVVAAEDANFCTHWGFDMAAIRTAIDEGSRRGASTIGMAVKADDHAVL
jgi:monofunctional biosynthetic peptidoglycan transglycosylase